MTTYVGRRDASPAQHLYAQAVYTLERAKKEPNGRTPECMVAIVLAAFSLEAVLNLLCEQTFVDKWGGEAGLKEWQEQARSLSPQSKLDLVVELHGLSVDMSREPFSLLESLFKYRNDLAHGKVWHSGDVVFQSKGTPRVGKHQRLVPPWMRAATVGNAEKYVHTVMDVADFLFEQTGYVHGLHISDTATFESVGPLDDDMGG